MCNWLILPFVAPGACYNAWESAESGGSGIWRAAEFGCRTNKVGDGDGSYGGCQAAEDCGTQNERDEQGEETGKEHPWSANGSWKILSRRTWDCQKGNSGWKVMIGLVEAV